MATKKDTAETASAATSTSTSTADTIIAAVREMDLPEISALSVQIDAIKRELAMKALDEQENRINELREMAGLGKRPGRRAGGVNATPKRKRGTVTS